MKKKYINYMHNTFYLNFKESFFKVWAKAFWRQLELSLISMQVRIMSFQWQRPPIHKITYNWYKKYSFENEKKNPYKKNTDIKTL